MNPLPPESIDQAVLRIVNAHPGITSWGIWNVLWGENADRSHLLGPQPLDANIKRLRDRGKIRSTASDGTPHRKGMKSLHFPVSP